MATNPLNHHHHHLLLFPLLFLISSYLLPHSTSQPQLTTSPVVHPDALPLLTLKSAVDKSNRLFTWNLTSTSSICSSWYGISCNQQPNGNNGGRVTKLVLESLNLTGTIPPSTLTSLTHLRVLSLSHNSLSGRIPSSLLSSSNLSSLRLIFLSHNYFSGPIPLPSLPHLYRLDLSHNNLTGPIPSQINQLSSHLLTLRLESNHLSGSISDLNLTTLQDFNVSDNNFGGEIPSPLSNFPLSSFSGNTPALCGHPLPPCKRLSSDPTKPGSSDSSSPPAANPGVVVSSTPSEAFPSQSKPSSGTNHDNNGHHHHHHHHSKLSFAAIILIVLADILVLALICLVLCWYFLRYYSSSSHGKHKKMNRSDLTSDAEKVVYSNTAYAATGGAGVQQQQYLYHNNSGGSSSQQQKGGFERGKMVFFEGAKRFELEDLLRASAEMLGKGVFGTAYKAVLDDGCVVAVKRLKVECVSGRRSGNEFEERMEVLGKLRHSNLVGLKAYYLAKDEKLLVFDYLPNGSLFWLLHGNRGPGRTPLDWTTRLKIAAGAARGIAFLHSSSNKTVKLTHGNIKSTNVLIDKDGHACVSDFGFATFIPQTTNSRSSNGYRAPEVTDNNRKLTAKSDVYSFGVLLLELLTGKCPSLVEETAPYDGLVVVDLPRWVQSVVREEWTAEVFDLELMRYKDIEEEMVGLLQIAMACTAASPDQRPKMAQVAKMIDDIRSGGSAVVDEESLSQDTTTSAADSPSVSSDNTCGVSQ